MGDVKTNINANVLEFDLTNQDSKKDNSFDSFNDIDISSKINIALQRAIKHFVSSQDRIIPEIKSQWPFEWGCGFDKSTNSQGRKVDDDILDSSCFLIHLSCLFKAISEANSSSHVAVYETELSSILSEPKLLVEFKRKQRDYHSVVRIIERLSRDVHDDKPLQDNSINKPQPVSSESEQILNEIVSEQDTDESSSAQSSSSDHLLYYNEIVKLLSNIRETNKLLNNTEDEQALENELELGVTTEDFINLDGNTVWAKRFKNRTSEITGFSELFETLLQHLLGVYESSQLDQDKSEELLFSHKLNSFHRSRIKNWQSLLEKMAFSQEDPINCYPFLSLHEAGDQYLVLICVSQIDELFVDERVKSDSRLPGITLAIYEIPRLLSSDKFDFELEHLGGLLKAAMGHLNMSVMSHRRGKALQAAAGEASNISRYWYGEGIIKLFETGKSEGAIDDKTVFDFWGGFVEELLCAKVNGVQLTEVFPFDRAFIFNQTGVTANKDQHEIEVHVLETALESLEAESRFEFKTSMQRGDSDLNNFDVTSKKVKYRNRVFIKKKDVNEEGDKSSGYHLIIDNNQNSIDPENIELEIKSDKSRKTDLSLNAILSTIEGDSETVKEVRTDVRTIYDKEGMVYVYRHGLSLKDEMPAINALNAAYLSAIRESYGDLRNDSSDSESSSESDRSKVVMFSFDPSLSQNLKQNTDNKAKEQKDNSDDLENQKFVMILVADNDPEKSLLELGAEKDDFELLVRMIIRQKIRERNLERTQIDKRIEALNSLMNGFIHEIKNRLAALDDVSRTKKEEEKIDKRWQEMRELMSFSDASLESLPLISESELSYGEQIIKIVQNYDSDDILSKIKNEINEQQLNCELEIKNSLVVGVSPSHFPLLAIKWPMSAVRNAFTVMLKNAVEAASDPEFKGERRISISVTAHQVDVTNKDSDWVVNITIVNSMNGISKDVLEALQAPIAKQIAQEQRNTSKLNSHGVGVFAARNLLKNCLGDRADIYFYPLNKHLIQVSMSLPAKIGNYSEACFDNDDIENNLNEGASPKSSEKYILYIEDEPVIADKNMAAVEPMLASSDISIKHTNNIQDAKALLESYGLPILLLADFNVLKTPLSQEANSRNLMNFLRKEYVKIVGESELSPTPIWLLTAESLTNIESSIKTFIGESKGKYSLNKGLQVDKDNEQFPSEFMEELNSVGVVSPLIGVKRIDLNDSIKNSLSKFIDDKCQTKDIVIGAVEEVRMEVDEQETMQLIPLTDKSFDSQLNAYFEHNKVKGDEDFNIQTVKLFVATALVDKVEELVSCISRWLSHEGLADLDYPDDQKTALNKSTVHSSIFLHIRLSNKLAKKVKPQFWYWAIANNILLTGKGNNYHEISFMWRTLPKGDNGAISKIRHDMVNLKTFDSYKELATKIIEYCREVDRLTEWKFNDNKVDAQSLFLSSNSDTLLKSDTQLMFFSQSTNGCKQLRETLMRMNIELERVKADDLPAYIEIAKVATANLFKLLDLLGDEE